MRKFISILLFTFSAFCSAAQVKITGYVTDVNNRPIEGAAILIKGSYDGGIADSSGKFSFTSSLQQRQVISVSALGYEEFKQEYFIDASFAPLAIILKEKFDELKAVVITAGSFEASDRKRAAAILNSMDIITTASANGDVTGALKTLPGAQQVGESEGLFVRGGTAAETKVFIDGTLVNRFFQSSAPNIAGAGRFNPFIFKGTVFSTGGYSALYGQALSSAVILESVDIPSRSSGVVNLSVLGVQSGVQLVNKKKTATAGINYNYSNMALAFAIARPKQEYSIAPQYHNLEGNFRLRTSATGILKYYGAISSNKLAFSTGSIDTLNYFDGFRLNNAYTYHNVSWKERIGLWKINAGISFTNNKDVIEAGITDGDGKATVIGGLEDKNFHITPLGNFLNAKLVAEKKLPGLSSFRIGSEYNFSNEQSTYTDYALKKYRFSVKDHISSVFGEADIYLTNSLAAKLGVRAEHSSGLGRMNAGPRLSLAYKTAKASQVSFAYGVFYQNPESKYLPAAQSLGFSRADHYILNFQKTYNMRVFRLEMFYKNYHQLLRTGIVNGRQGVAINDNGKGDAKGLEIFWRDKKTIPNFDYWVSYSYLDTKRDYLNFPSAITPNYAAQHTLNLVTKKFIMPIKTGVNMTYTYSSGRPYYNISYQAGAYKFTDRGTMKDLHNLSLSLNYVPAIGKEHARSFIVYAFAVNNLLNLKQQFGYRYSANGLNREAITPPSRQFIYLGVFLSFGINRTQDVMDNNF